ncbi:MAG: phytanoyl-CoA dioxygenase family protein [Chitinophagaceae bacterium]|nr:phytanoyl-CoA dioxygenase family protein [Chitinophagaceae bacterium]
MNIEHQFVKNGSVTEENIRFYHDYGYLIAPGLVSAADIAALKKDTAKIFRGEYGTVEGMLPVQPGETDEDILKKYVAIHFPHKLSPHIKNFLGHKGIVEVLKGVVSPNVKCMQSMLFVKAPGKAGQAWHQDEFYIPTRDCSLIGAWIAVDDATIENGCLWIIPGTHKPAYMMPRVDYNGTEYADVDTIDVSSYPKEKIIPVEVKSGTVVFFNGYVLHSSLRNKTTNNFRTALVNHYMSAERMLPWDQDGKLPPTNDLRDIVMVAGTDPYAYKGIKEANKPYLRTEVLNIKKD